MARSGTLATFLALLAPWSPAATGPQEDAPPASAAEGESVEDPWNLRASGLPVHPGVRFGVLANGVRTAWMDSAHPPGSAHLLLRVAAGSLAEEEDQLGMANFVRELNLHGTQRATAEEMRAWLAAHGSESALSDTSSSDYRQTLYALDLGEVGGAGGGAEERETALRRGLDLLRGFADPPRCTPEALDAARAAVAADEARRASDPLATAVLESYEILLAGTRIPERDPLGTAASRAAFDADGLRRFHRAWYRPENLTVILVADLGGADPGPWIEAAFGDLERPALPPREQPEPGYPPELPGAYVLQRPEFGRLVLSIERLRPAPDPERARAEWREDLAVQYGRRMLSLRLAELSQRPGAPFSVAGCDTASRGLGVFDGESMSITCTKDRWREALAACDLELRRALAYGFQPHEFERLRAVDMSLLSDAAEKSASQAGNQLAAEILGAAEGRLPPMGIGGRRDAYLPVMRALDAATCSAAFARSWEEGDLVVGSAGDLDLGPDGELLLSAAFAKVRRTQPGPPKRPDEAGFAYASDPEAAVEPVERVHHPEFGHVRLVYPNGVRVLLKDTGDGRDRVLVSARFGAGALSLPPERAALQWVASRVLFPAGLREHGLAQLTRVLAGRTVGADFSVREDFFEWTGLTNRDDLLLQFELLCAYLTEPGWRQEALAAVRARLPETFGALGTSLTGPLVAQFLPALYENDPRFGLPSREAIEAVDMDTVRAWLEPRLLEDALQVTVVGDLDVDAAVQAASRTFGALPRREGSRVVDAALRPVRMATGLRQDHTVAADGDRALIAIFYPTTDGRHAPTRHQFSFLGRLLAERLREEIPRRLGETAQVDADSFASTALEGAGYVQIRGAVAAGRAQEFVDACLETAATLAAEGTTEAEIARLRDPILKQLAALESDERYWIGALAETHNRPAALDELRAAPGHYRRMTRGDLDALAASYLRRDRASVLVVRPRAPAAPAEASSGGAEQDDPPGEADDGDGTDGGGR